MGQTNAYYHIHSGFNMHSLRQPYIAILVFFTLWLHVLCYVLYSEDCCPDAFPPPSTTTPTSTWFPEVLHNEHKNKVQLTIMYESRSSFLHSTIQIIIKIIIARSNI
jgi:hypothetical protein